MASRIIRVLIADDADLVLKVLVKTLSRFQDVEVVGVAADGAAALSQVAELLPDVIVMDVSMPVVDGIEATRRLRASHPRLGIILHTASSDNFAALLALGASAVVKKGVTPEELHAAIVSSVSAG